MMRPVGAIWADAIEGEFIPDDRETWTEKWCGTCVRAEDNQCPLIGVIASGYTPAETTPIECSTHTPKDTNASQDMPVLGNGEYVIVAPSHLPVAEDDTTFLPLVE